MSKKGEKSTVADFVCYFLKKRLLRGLYCSFWNFSAGEAAQTPMLTGGSSAGKAAQTSVLTGQLFCWGRLHRHQCLLEALLLGRLHKHQCLLGSSSAGEGCADTNAYWRLLLGKDAQTPVLTGQLFCWGRLHRYQCLLEALLLGKDAQTPVLTGRHAESLL